MSETRLAHARRLAGAAFSDALGRWSVLAVAWKTLKEQGRNRKNLRIALGLPLVFLVILGVAVDEPETAPLRVALLDEDGGELAGRFRTALAGAADAEGASLLDLRPVADEAQAREALRSGEIDLLLRIPAGFSERLGAAGEAPALVEMLADPSSPASQTAQRVVASLARAFADEAAGREPLLETRLASTSQRSLTTFDFLVPGVLVYGIIVLAPQVALLLAREAENGTILRIRMGRVGAAPLLGGVALAQAVFACASLLLMLQAARWMGWRSEGSLGVVFLVALATALAVVGLGLLLAAFARTQQEAANLGNFLAAPLALLSGAFLTLPPATLLRAGGVEVGAYDLLPTTHAVDALRRVGNLGADLGDVAWSIVALLGLAIAFFAAGAFAYQRRRIAIR